MADPLNAELQAKKAAGSRAFWYWLVFWIGVLLVIIGIVWLLAVHPQYIAAWYVPISPPVIQGTQF